MNDAKPKPRAPKLALRPSAQPLREEKPLDPGHPAALIYAAVLNAETIAQKQPLPVSEPPSISEPVIESEPPAEIDRGTPSVPTLPPVQTEPLIISEPVTISEPVLILSEKAAHLRFPYEVFDGVLSKLKPAPRVLLERLYRLSAGWDSDTCLVSIGKLASTCKIGETQVRGYLRDLEAGGYIKRLGDDIGNKDFEARGVRFKVLLPRMPPARNRTGSDLARGSESEPNKVKELKKDIKEFDASLCPDCNGTGWQPVDGDPAQAVKRCRHERLKI